MDCKEPLQSVMASIGYGFDPAVIFQNVIESEKVVQMTTQLVDLEFIAKEDDGLPPFFTMTDKGKMASRLSIDPRKAAIIIKGAERFKNTDLNLHSLIFLIFAVSTIDQWNSLIHYSSWEPDERRKANEYLYFATYMGQKQRIGADDIAEFEE